MGRGKKRNWKGNKGAPEGNSENKAQKSDGAQAERGPRGGRWEETERVNVAYEEYYKGLGLIPEGEFDSFMAALRRPLPITFRINGGGKYAQALKERLRCDFLEGLDLSSLVEEEGGKEVSPPAPLDWYPDQGAWQMCFSRNQLRKEPRLERLHEFIKAANEAGTITRQEAVSMVPPLFLDVQPQHAVLDVCAAPGSKTFQLLEMLHAGQSVGSFEPEGFVLANDVETRRCSLLTHQTKRVCSPALLVVNHDAQQLPSQLATQGNPIELPEGRMRFDRVLADVPCTGDGTLRKNTDIWSKWHPTMGCSLHRLQLSIATRAAHILKVGGRMVYSTCSLNPVEDEAVVAALLKAAAGALQLVDVSSSLPSLRRLPGVSQWRLRDQHGWKDSFDQTPRAQCITPSMFPPTQQGGEDAPLHLDRCMRFLPHHSDTGGFFVAVITKVSEMAAITGQLTGGTSKKNRGDRGGAPGGGEEEAEPLEAGGGGGGEVKKEETAEEEQTGGNDAGGCVVKEEAEKGGGEDVKADGGEVAAAASITPGPSSSEAPPAASGGGGPPQPAKRGRWSGIDPVFFMKNPETLQSLVDFYGFKESFPLRSQLISRNPEENKPKRLYLISQGLGKVLRTDTHEKLKVICAGVKCFERQDKEEGVPCAYRLAQEGLQLTLPHLTKQRVNLKFEEYTHLLIHRALPFKRDTSDIATKLFCPESLAQLDACNAGCCIIVPELKSSSPAALLKSFAPVTNPEDLAISCWLGKASVSLMVSKAEAAQLLERVGVDGRQAFTKPKPVVVKANDAEVGQANVVQKKAALEVVDDGGEASL